MPLDRMFVDPMLNPFRNMMKDVEGRGLTGPDVDAMKQALAYMEQLASDTDDLAAYSGKLAQEQVFQKFSDAYSRALSSAAASQAPESDDQMMANTLKAYEGALDSYRRGEAGKEGEMLIPVMERIMELGRSGISYPVFLRRLEEEGLNKALDGVAPAARHGIEQDLKFAQDAWLPIKVDEVNKRLQTFDAVAARSPFGQPDPLELELADKRIEWEFAPLHARREALVVRFAQVLDLLVDWIDSFAKFAPTDERWTMPPGTPAQVQQRIRRTQECTPGDLHYRESILKEYFGLEFKDMWTHDTFLWEYAAHRVEWSDQRLQLIFDSYPHCKPGNRPPPELVAMAEELHPAQDYRPDRLRPPPWGTPQQLFKPVGL